MLNVRCFFVAVAFLLAAAPLSAQQLFIDSLWVSSPDFANCKGPDADGHYMCEGPANVGICPTAGRGNISNNPRLEFDRVVPNSCFSGTTIVQGSTTTNVCNDKVMLCAAIGYVNNESAPSTDVGIDKLYFELFKYGSGSNPLDPASTPPLRTFFIDQPGTMLAATAATIPSAAQCTAVGLSGGGGCGFCAIWDGNINILGEQGKSNGTYGYRATVETNRFSASAGNITLGPFTRAYPGGATLQTTPSGGACDGVSFVSQAPITVDVTNVHVVRSTPTIVGVVTGVAAEPYNITYRLSKDATMYMTIHNPGPVVRSIVNGQPRVGEGVPDGNLQNGDAWNGRADNGGLLPPGVYLASLFAQSQDQFGMDLSAAVTRQIALDPLQITDILVQPLTAQSTSLAVLTYTLTEPATVYIDIYPPGTQFCDRDGAGPAPSDPLNQVNNPLLDNVESSTVPPKEFNAKVGPCSAGPGITPLRRFAEQKDFRKQVVSFWDGRDALGNVMPDGDYVFVLYAALPSQNGFEHNGTADKRIWTSVARSGFISISRGFVTISQVSPASTVVGSSPAVAGLNPFVFSYSLSRDGLVSMRIFDQTGLVLKRTLVVNQVRPGNFLNKEHWIDGFGDDGRVLSSGTYTVELTAADPFFASKVTTTTALFPLDMFRITDVLTGSLLTGATDVATIGYQLTQAMNVAWNIYPPGTLIQGSTATWPPCGTLTPGVCSQTLNGAGTPIGPLISVTGMRPGRLRITEFWDGRDQNGLFVPDGNYIFTLAAKSTTTPSYFAADRVMGQLTLARGSVVFQLFTVKPTVPQLFNSSQSVTLPPFEMDYLLTRQSSVTIKILDTRIPPTIVRNLITGQVREGQTLNQDFWDARDDRGNFVQPGFYTVQAVAYDLASQLSSGSTIQQTIAVNPLRIYDIAISPLSKEVATALISYQVSETMKVSIKIYRPGTTFDGSGNPTPPERLSLVRRIVGVRPSRSEINEVWDGRDEALALLADGNYIFRIVGSTDTRAIDSVTGNVSAGASLAEDLVIAEVPVVRSESLNPQTDFEDNTFVYPNPIVGPSATFSIYLPFQSNVSVKIFNIAGELVYERGYSNQARSTDNGPIVFNWAKVNAHGKTVAPGVYFVLIREEETLGGSNILQTVKKLVIK